MRKKPNYHMELEKKNHFQMYDRFPVTFISGEGSKVRDNQGNEYIDALAGIAVNSVGHCHPRVVAAIKKQAGQLIHCSNFFYNSPQSELSEILCKISELDKVFFCNSGVEAVEGAIKLARRYAFENNRSGSILGMENCFHGRTIAVLSLGKEKYKKGFEPLPAGFTTIPFNDLTQLKKITKKPIIAIILETVQGEGGIYPVKKEFLQEIRKVCDKMGIPLILDEIQCGLGRTGKMFAFQHYGIKPDILVLAKALGGGVPIGAVLAKEHIARVFGYGDHGTTFGGNPLACAAALATIKIIRDENLCEQAWIKGNNFKEKLKRLSKKSPLIKEIRGKGLMIGIEIRVNAREVVKRMLEKGIIANSIGDNIVRFVPPLTISQTDLDQIVDVFTQVLREDDINGGS